MGKTIKKLKAEKVIGIDYPKSCESIPRKHYAVRISSAACATVEVCIDAGAWSPCSNSSGFWWFHLQGLTAGEHRIAARVQIEGKAFFSLRKFHVGDE